MYITKSIHAPKDLGPDWKYTKLKECWFWKHHWMLWDAVYKNAESSPGTWPPSNSQFEVRSKKCCKCGLIKYAVIG